MKVRLRRHDVMVFVTSFTLSSAFLLVIVSDIRDFSNFDQPNVKRNDIRSYSKHKRGYSLQNISKRDMSKGIFEYDTSFENQAYFGDEVDKPLDLGTFKNTHYLTIEPTENLGDNMFQYAA